MSIISESLRAAVWFALCVFMAIGMVIFALVYAAIRVTLRKIIWKQVSFPQTRFAG